MVNVSDNGDITDVLVHGHNRRKIEEKLKNVRVCRAERKAEGVALQLSPGVPEGSRPGRGRRPPSSYGGQAGVPVPATRVEPWRRQMPRGAFFSRQFIAASPGRSMRVRPTAQIEKTN